MIPVNFLNQADAMDSYRQLSQNPSTYTLNNINPNVKINSIFTIPKYTSQPQLITRQPSKAGLVMSQRKMPITFEEIEIPHTEQENTLISSKFNFNDLAQHKSKITSSYIDNVSSNKDIKSQFRRLLQSKNDQIVAGNRQQNVFQMSSNAVLHRHINTSNQIKLQSSQQLNMSDLTKVKTKLPTYNEVKLVASQQLTRSRPMSSSQISTFRKKQLQVEKKLHKVTLGQDL